MADAQSFNLQSKPSDLQRQRGFALTPAGRSKLQQRLLELEAQTGVKYNAARISQQIQIVDPKGLHATTVRKILRQEAVDFATLQILFHALSLELAEADRAQPSPTKAVPQTRQDWGEALDIEQFFGRNEALETLRTWLVTDRCRVITLLGMGGMGKTALSIKLAQQAKPHFTAIIWRSLRNTPPLEFLLKDCLQFLSNQQKTDLPPHLNGQIAQIMDALRQHRCLLVFDNVESILSSGSPAGRYRSGCEGYQELFQQIAGTPHQSSLILTGREKPQGLSAFEGEALPVRLYRLGGLESQDGQNILRTKGLDAAASAGDQLIEKYQGNPLALKIVATSIHDLFSGNIEAFLAEDAIAFSEIRQLLDQQLARLSYLEQQVLYWLAIARQPIPLATLQEDIIPPTSTSKLFEAIESIDRRSLIEICSGTTPQFTLQPVIMEYITDQLIESISEELLSPLNAQGLFSTHALIKANTWDYIREIQARLVLAPIVEIVILHLGGLAQLEAHLKQYLSALQTHPAPNYAAGNILNILTHLQIDLSGYDLSGLTIWQAYLQGINLYNVNVAAADVSKSEFTKTFGDIYSATFSPNGEWIATGHNDGIPRVWHVSDGTLLLAYQGHQKTVWSVAFSPDGQTLASGSFDHTISLWDLAKGQGKQTLSGHCDRIWSLAFSPTQNTLASSSNDHTIKIWETETGACLQTLKEHTDGVTSLHYHPAGNLLASGSADQTVRLWDLASGQVTKILTGHTSPLTCVAFSPDGQYLASSEAQMIKLWDVQTGHCLHTIDHLTSVWSLAFSGDGKRLGAGDRQYLRFWHVPTGALIQCHTGYDSQIWAVAFSPDGQQFVACDKQKIGLWRVNAHPENHGNCLIHRTRTLQGYTNAVWSIAFSPDGQTLTTGSTDQIIRIWDLETHTCSHKLRQPYSRCVAFSPDGKAVVSGGENGSLQVWETDSGLQSTLTTCHNGKIWTIAFAPDDQQLASGGADQTIRLWDTINHQCLRTLRGHTGWVLSVTFAPSHHTLISSSTDQSIKFWDLQTGACYQTLTGHTGSIWSVAISAQMLASASEDGTIKLWDFPSGQCRQTLRGHDSLVFTVQFSPDGQTLASGGADNTIRLWDIVTGQCRQILTGHTHSIWSIAFSPDGKHLVSGGQDSTLRLWAVDSGQPITTFTLEKPYEGLNIMGTQGLTHSRRQMLQALGAIEK